MKKRGINGHVLEPSCKECREDRCDGSTLACSFTRCMLCGAEDDTPEGEKQFDKLCKSLIKEDCLRCIKLDFNCTGGSEEECKEMGGFIKYK